VMVANIMMRKCFLFTFLFVLRLVGCLCSTRTVYFNRTVGTGTTQLFNTADNWRYSNKCRAAPRPVHVHNIYNEKDYNKLTREAAKGIDPPVICRDPVVGILIYN
jgi:hypothetical protein